MQPGVPFPLVGGVLLLAVVGWAALAVAAVAVRGRPRTAAALLCAGAAVLVVVETVTATTFGDPSSDPLALARAAGLLLVAAGLSGGALTGPGADDAPPAGAGPTGAGPVAAAPAVVVPLAAGPAPAALAAAGGLLAAVAALRVRQGPSGPLLATGLLLAGAAAGLAPLADDSAPAATSLVVVRGLAAAVLCAAVLALARQSLLAKVVAAILAGVVAMAAAAVGVVGTTVARGYEREQASLVRDAAQGRSQLLQQSLDQITRVAPVIATGCAGSDYEPADCDAFLRVPTRQTAEDFAVLLPAGGDAVLLGGRAPLSPAEALGLAGSPLAALAAQGGVGAARDPVGGYVRLLGAQPGLAIAVAVPVGRPTPDAPPSAVFVYGERLGRQLVTEDIESGGYGYTFLVGDAVAASNLSLAEQDLVREAVALAGGVPRDGVTVPALGSRPTVHLRPLVDATDGAPVGTIALSRDSETSLAAQRDALRALLLTALATTAVVAGLAVVLGRRTVDPVRRLTAAAERVRGGDLATRTGVGGPDEVGTLARAFDAMTGSLSQVQGDLRTSAARLETVLASMSDGLVAADADGRTTGVNRAARALAGLPDDVEGRPLADVLDLRLPTGAPLVLDPDVVRDEPAVVRRPDGGTTPVRVAVTRLAGEEEGLVVVLRDTTQEAEVERMKTEFLSNVSHELRTPLTPIRGYADLLANRSGLTEQQVRTFAGTVLAEALKMNRVVDLLVDVAAVEAGRAAIRPQPVHVKALLDGRLAAWRDKVPERAADLRRRVAAGLPPVDVDAAWFGKVLDELVDNALKYSAPGTPVVLTATAAPDGERVRVAVRDAGPGVDTASDRLFTSFEQVDGSATRRVGGLGLGLSFVGRVASDAGWPLTVTSPVSAGKGAEFALDLPRAATAPASAAAPRRARVPGQGRSPARPAGPRRRGA
jgi:PAS domain S-box-containing protein